MTVILAFISGMGVTAASLFIPHARNTPSSVEDFKTFQKSLAELPVTRVKKQQRVH